MSDTFNSLCPNCASDLIPGDPVCPECGITMDGIMPRGEAGSAAGGDQISAGNISDAQGVAIGRGAQAVRVDDVTGTLIQAQRLVQSSIFTNSTITIQQQAQAGGMRRASKFQIFPPADFYVPRAEFEERLADLLKHRSDGLNVVGLYGLPGVGSSMMVRKVASGMKDEFPDGMLWVDVEDKSEVDVLWGLIEPYETPAERSPFRDGRHYLGDLQGILADKRVLIVLDQVRPENGEVVSKVLPRGCAGVCVLLVSSTPLPGLFREENSVCLQELMPDEAEQLFRNIWRGSFSATTAEVVRAMAGELGYLPTQIVLVARDIINRQIAPQDYLEELRRQKKERQLTVASENPGLQTVYENLPAKGRDIFPYIGVVGASGWTLEDLVTVSQLKRHEVEVGLRQLVLAGFLRGDIEGGYRCSPVVRRFALSLLLDIGGEALVQSCYAVLARHILRQATRDQPLIPPIHIG